MTATNDVYGLYGKYPVDPEKPEETIAAYRIENGQADFSDCLILFNNKKGRYPETISRLDAWNKYWNLSTDDIRFALIYCFLRCNGKPPDEIFPLLFTNAYQTAGMAGCDLRTAGRKSAFWFDVASQASPYRPPGATSLNFAAFSLLEIGPNASASVLAFQMGLSEFSLVQKRPHGTAVSYGDVELAHCLVWKPGVHCKRASKIIGEAPSEAKVRLVLGGNPATRDTASGLLQAGSFDFSMQSRLDALDPSIRYRRVVPGARAGADTLQFALCDKDSATETKLTVRCRINPLFADDPAKTDFRFHLDNAQEMPLSGTFIAPDHARLGLAIIDQVSGLCWNRQAGSTAANPNLYFSPSGEYKLTAPPGHATRGANSGFSLACGLRADETVHFPGQETRIRFVPGQAASILVPADAENNPAEFSCEDTTSFVSFNQATYTCQPLDAALYSQSGPILVPAPPPVGLAAGTAIPLIPHAGARNTQPAVQVVVEKTAVATARTAAILTPRERSERASPPITAGAGEMVTPQGLRIKVGANGVWTAALLHGNNNAETVTMVVDEPLQRAIRHGDLFAVVGGSKLSGTLAVSGDMKVTLPIGGDFDSILVMKLCRGSFVDWLAKPAAWAGVSGLPVAAEGMAQWLQNHIGSAAGSSDPNYAYLSRLLTDESWTGLLFVNIPLKGDKVKLPTVFDQFSASLAAADGLCLHYVAVPLSGLGLDIACNEVNGLVNYTDAEYAAACMEDSANADAPVPFTCSLPNERVLRLSARIEKSVITDARYLVQIRVPELFGSSVDAVLANNGDDLHWVESCLMLTGGEQVEDGVKRPAFSQLRPVRYRLGCQAIESIAIDQVQRLGGVSGKAMRLAVSGSVDFVRVADFDLLSFGATADNVPGGLQFTGLLLEQKDEAGSESDNAPLRCSYTNLALTMADGNAANAPRAGSLFREFPLTLKRLARGAKGASTNIPKGYIAVDTGRSLSPLGNVDWMGLQGSMTIGSTGPLGDDSAMDVSVIIAWDPAAAQMGKPAMAVWMRLPGSDGASLPGIQNLVSLGFGEICLERTAQKGRASSFCLSFLDAGIKVFNKTFPPGASMGLRLAARPASSGADFSLEKRALGWVGYILNKDRQPFAQ